MSAVLDANVILYLFGGRLAQPLPRDFYFALVITEMELLSYPSLHAETEMHIRAFLSEITVVGLTRDVKEIAIRLRREYGLKLPDAIVVGAAMVLNVDLLTNDRRLSMAGEAAGDKMSRGFALKRAASQAARARYNESRDEMSSSIRVNARASARA